MEFNFNSNGSSSYIKYSGYHEVLNGKESYMTPNLGRSINIRNMYNIFANIEKALVDILNAGRLCINDDRERLKFNVALAFVEDHGLLGFMLDAPVSKNFLQQEEVILKDDNIINKDCIMKTKDYFKVFFPFTKEDELSYSVSKNGEVIINTTSDLQRILEYLPPEKQLAYSSFYCEKIDWIIDYAKKMYKVFEQITNYSKHNDEYISNSRIRDNIEKYTCSGVPYRIHMSNDKPEIEWEPNSLKQALDLVFGLLVCSDKNPLRICKYCGRVFWANNPKAEYCSSSCRNRANVYKSREKNKK